MWSSVALLCVIGISAARVAAEAQSAGLNASPSAPFRDHSSWALLVDAGSTGSRMHLYEWAPRVFDELPPPISKPITSEKWTERMRPGLSAFSEDAEQAAKTLEPLIAFAKSELADLSHRWHHFPIFLKATAGMRELPFGKREAIMEAVRTYLADNRTCPFAFKANDQVRVIAGEEEAAYAWTAVNFVTGALLESSWGTGTATPARAFGSLEMGGGSSQIAFFRPEQDILANLFKLQIGDSKHWNVYAHSFLQYGRVSAKQRMWSNMAARKGCFDGNFKTPCHIIDECLASGHSTGAGDLKGRPGLHPPFTHSPMYTNITVKPPAGGGSWEGCLRQIAEPLGFTGPKHDLFNTWCNFSHTGQCSFVGVYQPEIPASDSPYGNFFLIGEYVKIWQYLGLSPGSPKGSSLRAVQEAASQVCAMTDEELLAWFKPTSIKAQEEVQNLCFLSAFAFSMLYYGHGFDLDRNFTAVAVMDYLGGSLKVGWQLGSILYEINALPWELEGCQQTTKSVTPSTSLHLVTAIVSCLATLTVTAFVLWFRSTSVLGAMRKEKAPKAFVYSAVPGEVGRDERPGLQMGEGGRYGAIPVSGMVVEQEPQQQGQGAPGSSSQR